MREERVVALDREHRLPRRNLIAVVQGSDLERVPVVRAELQHCDRLVHAAEDRLVLLEHLHQNVWAAPVGEQRFAREVEIRVGVIAGADLLDGEVERLGRETVTRHAGDCNMEA